MLEEKLIKNKKEKYSEEALKKQKESKEKLNDFAGE